jgi:hypothetical protein
MVMVMYWFWGIVVLSDLLRNLDEPVKLVENLIKTER